jgi:hypothetical protein
MIMVRGILKNQERHWTQKPRRMKFDKVESWKDKIDDKFCVEIYKWPRWRQELKWRSRKIKEFEKGGKGILQQKMSLYIKWFYWIMDKFNGYSEQDLVRNNELNSLMNMD